jgi:3-deoxy-D-manno-octulosonic-acid transferase
VSLPERLYGMALSLAGPALRLRLALRARDEPLYGERVGERFGRYDAVVRQALAVWHETPGPRLWIHAVSLGETRAALALADALRLRCPGLRLLWTHGTATGRAAGAEALQAGDVQVWQPFDSPGAVRRFFDAARPPVGVLMETEIWPGLLGRARVQGVPMVIANARLSERSARRGERWRRLLKPAVQGLQQILAQTPEDAGRLVAAGADASRTQVCGNLKFDMTPPPERLALGRAWTRALQGRPVVLFASSREGEEAGLLDAWGRLRASDSTGAALAARALLLIVPRHPPRFDEVAGLVAQRGLRSVRRSAWGESQPGRAAGEADVWVGDSLGEMAAYGAAADVALLGGSFAPLGGQNLIELAACGCPVILGPHTFNFADAAERAIAAGAAARVASIDDAVQVAFALIERDRGSGPFSATGAPRIDRTRALAFAEAHRGAAQRMAQAIAALLPR